jgi:adenylate kinase
MSKEINTFLMMGKTGSGKGEQSRLLSEKTGYKIFSSGDKFRELRLKNDWLGSRIRQDYDKGLLMPHWFASFVFIEELLARDVKDGLIFEGTGRKKPEAELFNEVVSWLGREYVVFNIKVSDEEVIKRSQKRGRSDGLDSSLEKIELRIKEYRMHTEPALEYFKSIGRLVEINGEQTIEEVHQDIIKAIKL